MEDKCKMPSGNDYGYVIRYGYVDGKDFTLALSVTDSEERNAVKFHWVIEHYSGEIVFNEERRPIHDPIFGVDEIEWRSWVTSMYPVIDEYIKTKQE